MDTVGIAKTGFGSEGRDAGQPRHDAAEGCHHGHLPIQEGVETEAASSLTMIERLKD